MASKKQLTRHLRDQSRANGTPMEHRFVVDAEAFDEFAALLDREPQVNPRLAARLATPTVFDTDVFNPDTDDFETWLMRD